MSELLEETAGDMSLGEEDYSKIRSVISSYQGNYSDMDFESVYSFQTTIDSAILDLVNQNMIDQLDSASEGGSELFTRYNAATAGVVEYYIDGMEEATAASIDPAWFEEEGYERQELRSADLVSEGEPVVQACDGRGLAAGVSAG